MVWQGENAVATGRKILGQTKPFESAPGSLRGDNCVDVGRNAIHGSDSTESAKKEIEMWFTQQELINWKQASQVWVSEKEAELA